MQFDENNSKYRCCCSEYHSTKGVVLLSGISGICTLGQAYSLFFGNGEGSGIDTNSTGMVILRILCTVVATGFVAAAFFAVHGHKHIFLVPHIVVLGVICALFLLLSTTFLLLGISGCSFFLADVIASGAGVPEPENSVDVLTVVNSTNGTSEFFYRCDALKAVGYAGMVGYFIIAAVQFWFLSIFLSAYRYLRDKYHTPPAASSQQQSQPESQPMLVASSGQFTDPGTSTQPVQPAPFETSTHPMEDDRPPAYDDLIHVSPSGPHQDDGLPRYGDPDCGISAPYDPHIFGGQDVIYGP